MAKEKKKKKDKGKKEEEGKGTKKSSFGKEGDIEVD